MPCHQLLILITGKIIHDLRLLTIVEQHPVIICQRIRNLISAVRCIALRHPHHDGFRMIGIYFLIYLIHILHAFDIFSGKPGLLQPVRTHTDRRNTRSTLDYRNTEHKVIDTARIQQLLTHIRKRLFHVDAVLLHIAAQIQHHLIVDKSARKTVDHRNQIHLIAALQHKWKLRRKVAHGQHNDIHLRIDIPHQDLVDLIQNYLLIGLLAADQYHCGLVRFTDINTVHHVAAFAFRLRLCCGLSFGAAAIILLCAVSASCQHAYRQDSR